MLLKTFQPLADLYASTHPHGTYTGIDFGTPSKAFDSTVGGVAALHVTEVKALQNWKVPASMPVTLSPIVTEVKA